MLDLMTKVTPADVKLDFPNTPTNEVEQEWAARLILREALAPFVEMAILLDAIDKRRDGTDFVNVPLSELRQARQAYNCAARILGEGQV